MKRVELHNIVYFQHHCVRLTLPSHTQTALSCCSWMESFTLPYHASLAEFKSIVANDQEVMKTQSYKKKLISGTPRDPWKCLYKYFKRQTNKMDIIVILIWTKNQKKQQQWNVNTTLRINITVYNIRNRMTANPTCKKMGAGLPQLHWLLIEFAGASTWTRHKAVPHGFDPLFAVWVQEEDDRIPLRVVKSVHSFRSHI